MIDNDTFSISIAQNTVSHKKSTTNSFLSILDDKNKLIESLRTQLKNQKMQILYYMRKDLSSTKLIKLSETCTTQMIEENIPVVLALDSFKRRNGHRSNMFNLYEHMRDLDEDLMLALQRQKIMLKKVVGKLLKQSSGDTKLNDSNLDLFQRLIEATSRLDEKLEAFRLSCNRLILVEDERNLIAEQVLALPAHQRMNYNFLVGFQMQNKELHKRIKSIEQSRAVQKKEMSELSVIEQKLSQLQQQINSSFNENGVEDMVKELSFEATHLLDSTNNYKEKCRKELRSVESSNASFLNKVLLFIKSAMADEAFDEAKFFSAREQPAIRWIRTEIDKAKAKICKDLNRTRSENGALKSKLNKALLEKNELKFAYCQLQTDYENLKTEYSKEMSNLGFQRDNYSMSQLKDLAMIRDAYMEIEEQPPNQATGKKNELRARNMRLEERLEIMKNIIEKQNKEISLQGDFIEKLKDHNQRAWRKNYVLKTSQISSDLISSMRYSSERSFRVDDEVSDAILVTEESYNWTDSNMFNSSRRSCVSNIENRSSLSYYTFYSENTQMVKEMRTVINGEGGNGRITRSSFALQMNRRCRNKEEENADASREEIGKSRECFEESGELKPITVLAIVNNKTMSSSSDENSYHNL